MKRTTLFLCLMVQVLSLLFLPGLSLDAQEKATETQHPQSSANASQTKPPDTEQIHTAFKISPDQVNAAVKLGEDTFRKKRKMETFVDRYRQNPQWTRGKRGRSHESYVWALSFEGLPLSVEAYRKASLYEDLKIPEKLRGEGGYLNSLRFSVSLNSISKVARNIFQGNRDADERDVKVIKFVLSDDKGNNIMASEGSTEGEQTSGSMTFSGVAVRPEYGRSNTFSSASGTATGAGGTVSGTATGYSTSTYRRFRYEAWSVERPYYSASYIVEFPLFDEEGKPKISREARQIFLRVITESGELTATYKLPSGKKR
jgi:hypothetical protein